MSEQLSVQRIGRQTLANGEQRDDELRAGFECRADASACGWNEHVSVWEWTGWRTATRWLRVSSWQCAGECEAVDGCEWRGDAGEELRGVWDAADECRDWEQCVCIRW